MRVEFRCFEGFTFSTENSMRGVLLRNFGTTNEPSCKRASKRGKSFELGWAMKVLTFLAFKPYFRCGKIFRYTRPTVKPVSSLGSYRLSGHSRFIYS